MTAQVQSDQGETLHFYETEVTMNKKEIYQYLDERGIKYETVEHKAVFTMEELQELDLPESECDAQNMFIRDATKRDYYLITVKGSKRVDLKEFRSRHGLRALSFASAEERMRIMGLLPGSVTPFGILNDTDRRVHCYRDEGFKGGRIAVHPNENTATVWLRTGDLVRLIKEHGNEVEFVEV